MELRAFVATTPSSVDATLKETNLKIYNDFVASSSPRQVPFPQLFSLYFVESLIRCCTKFQVSLFIRLISLRASPKRWKKPSRRIQATALSSTALMKKSFLLLTPTPIGISSRICSIFVKSDFCLNLSTFLYLKSYDIISINSVYPKSPMFNLWIEAKAASPASLFVSTSPGIVFSTLRVIFHIFMNSVFRIQ